MEHMPALCVFVFLQAYAAVSYLDGLASAYAGGLVPVSARASWHERYFEYRKGAMQVAFIASLFTAAVLCVTGYIGGLAGRSMTLLDPSFAHKHMPIIASVSEHQPTTWTNYFLDLHLIIPLVPVGLYYLFQGLNEAQVGTCPRPEDAYACCGMEANSSRFVERFACIEPSVCIIRVCRQVGGVHINNMTSRTTS